MNEDDLKKELWLPRSELRCSIRRLEGERLRILEMLEELAREREKTSRLRTEIISIKRSKMWWFWMKYQAARRIFQTIPLVGILLQPAAQKVEEQPAAQKVEE